MRIAIAGPSPVPFSAGGIEALMSGLYQTLTQNTEHQTELIKLPSPEGSFWDVIESYYRFYKLDLGHFDVVIAVKYPAWMTEHPNMIIYMAHCLRGLYDTYHLSGLPEETPGGDPYVDDLLEYMDCYPRPADLDAFFGLVFRLKEHSGEIDPTHFSFPGPLIRKIVRYMDRYAMEKHGPEKYFAISDTVAGRKDYFPQGAVIETVYPPSGRKAGASAEPKHIFTMSRLDRPKRLDLLVRAMKYVKSGIPLLIAGTGPEREHLEELAENDPRIRFLGYVTDAEAEQYYAEALFVPFLPYEEDYGYITIEAMLHRKPVLTVRDSGGPTEFVRDYETGFVTDTDPVQIAEKIDWFAQHPDKAEEMGRRAYAEVENISWDNVVSRLLESVREIPEKRTDRRQVTVLSSFPVWPPQNGGQARIYNLYRQIADMADVRIEVIGRSSGVRRLGSGYYQRCACISSDQRRKEDQLNQRCGMNVTDIAALLYAGSTPEYTENLKESIMASDLTIVSHPYTYYEAKEFLKGRPFVYEAHNVESVMKEQMIPECPDRQLLIDTVFEAEKECCENSCLIMTCSLEDQVTLNRVYGVSTDKMILVPNGVECSGTVYTSQAIRTLRKKALGLEGQKTALFMGSWHGPNIEAAEIVLQLAYLCPEITFLLMGSQCAYFTRNHRIIPENVALLGLVSEEEKARIFSAVDIALNPMLSGSGTNLKMFDYMAAGIPVVTTAFGARGITDRSSMIVAEPLTEMAEVLRGFTPEKGNILAKQARRCVEENYDWKVIAQPLKEFIRDL